MRYMIGKTYIRPETIVRLDSQWYPGEVCVVVEDIAGMFGAWLPREDVANLLFPSEP